MGYGSVRPLPPFSPNGKDQPGFRSIRSWVLFTAFSAWLIAALLCCTEQHLEQIDLDMQVELKGFCPLESGFLQAPSMLPPVSPRIPFHLHLVSLLQQHTLYTEKNTVKLPWPLQEGMPPPPLLTACCTASPTSALLVEIVQCFSIGSHASGAVEATIAPPVCFLSTSRCIVSSVSRFSGKARHHHHHQPFSPAADAND